MGYRWTDVPLRRKGLVCVAIPMAALAVAIASYLVVQARQELAQERVTHTLEVQRQIQHLTKLMVDAETGVRGFILTGEPSFLDTYRAAVDGLDPNVEMLRVLVADNPSQLRRLAEVRRMSRSGLKLLDELVVLSGRGDVASRRIEPLLLEGKVTMDRLRGLLNDMEGEERELLAGRTEAADGARDLALVVIVITGLLGLLGGLVAVILFTNGVVGRAQRVADNARRLSTDEELLPIERASDEIGALDAEVVKAATLLKDRRTELTEARRFLEQLISSSPVIIFRRQIADLAITYISPNVERILGYLPTEVMKVRDFWQDRIHPGDRATWESETERVLASHAGQLQRTPYRFRDAEGEYRWLETTATIEYVDGRAVALLAYALDVTARKVAEQSLADRELTLSAILDTSPDIIAILDIEGRRRYVSPALHYILGFEADDLAGAELTPLTHPDDRRLANELIRRALNTREPVRARYRMRHAAGHWVWVDVRARRIDSPSGFREEIVLAVREVTAQVELEEALRKAKEEAESSNRAKSDFLSRMSHELRTPLNAILGFAQILEMDTLTAEQRDGVEEILKGGRHLLDLINEVLDIARIETGRLALSIEPCPIDGVINESVGLVRPLAAQRHIELTWPTDLDPAWHAMADRQRLKQVLLNLLSNAVKYNRHGGKVRISCTQTHQDNIQIEVADTGPGIPLENMDLLFSPFERLGAEQTAVEGTGLGLALSKRLIEAMGGTIGVRSSPGTGSRFTLELSLVEGPVERLRRVGGRPEKIAGDGSKRTLLYVEDNLSNLKLVEHILAGRPEVTLHATMQGLLGVELAREHTPDLVLLDLNLPDMPGSEVLALLHDDPRTTSIPVVVISADATEGQIDRLLRAGAAGYLTKPLDIRRFLAVVDSVLSGALPGAGDGDRVS